MLLLHDPQSVANINSTQSFSLSLSRLTIFFLSGESLYAKYRHQINTQLSHDSFYTLPNHFAEERKITDMPH